jgi:drug/metabolite transporter (DMT)-like permease
MHPLDWLIASLGCTALAQVAFKLHARNRRRWQLGSAIALFLLVPYTTYNALRGLSLDTVYVATAASQLLVVALSLAFMGERYSPRQYAGFLLVLAGIVLYNR